MNSIHIGSLALKKPFMNGSGIFSDHPFLLQQWIEDGTGAVVTKSITLHEKQPNPFSYVEKKIICVRGRDYTVNAMGLPNRGVAWWKDQLKRYTFSVPLIASIAMIDDVGDYAKIVAELDDRVDAFEVNVSCPNVKVDILGYNVEGMRDALSRIDTKKPLIVKLPCYFKRDSFADRVLVLDDVGRHWLKDDVIVRVPMRVNEVALKKVLDVLDDLAIRVVTSHNTIPVLHPLLSTKRGGLSGMPIHDIAVEQARSISENSNKTIIASGGVLTAQDARDFLEIKNVKAIQLASGLFRYESPKTFIDALRDGLFS